MQKMTTVEALRTCLYENGIEMLLDYPKLRGKLWDLAPAELLWRDRFRAIYESGAVEHIRQAVAMEPDNWRYQNLLDQLQQGETGYRQRAESYEGYSGIGSLLMRLCLCLGLQWCCCRC